MDTRTHDMCQVKSSHDHDRLFPFLMANAGESVYTFEGAVFLLPLPA